MTKTLYFSNEATSGPDINELTHPTQHGVRQTWDDPHKIMIRALGGV